MIHCVVTFAVASLGLLSPSPNDSQNPAHDAIANAVNNFTFRLVNATGTPTDKNFLLSPFSVSTAMAMLIPGTQSTEQGLLLKAIVPGMSAQRAVHGYGSLSRTMVSDSLPTDPLQKLNTLINGAPLSIANSAWVDSRMKLSTPYSRALRISFGATVSPFKHDQSSVNEINSWVSKRTRNRIATILDQLKDADRFILINAVAFDGQWAKQFDKSRTTPQAFHPIGKPALNVPMMHMKEEVGYYKSNTVRAIKLNYKGDGFSMVLMLPEKDNDAGALLRKMNAKAVDSLMAAASSDKVEITVPKFKFSDSHQLAQPLSAMGLAALFNEVDFSKISSGLRRGRIDRVIHKTFIEVDEKGTKAAGATGIVMQPTMVRVDQPMFIADRPFAFLIVHNRSHAILFAGVVNKP
jgi:serine protease inhibitor